MLLIKEYEVIFIRLTKIYDFKINKSEFWGF